jgi:hypothetical protein
MGAQGCEKLASKCGKGGRRQILFAELEEINTGCGDPRGLFEQGSFARSFVSREAGAIRDGVTKHGFKCRTHQGMGKFAQSE